MTFNYHTGHWKIFYTNNQWTFLPELDLFKPFSSPEYTEQ
jgi:hypothetical protein